ncbi:MAG: sigma-70 family RNA polymerase sigma factor [Bryobacteraceae bacterium]|nr:sigma-70 family RNA polymerase sigma factor [Bryobacteraceae bacterium]
MDPDKTDPQRSAPELNPESVRLLDDLKNGVDSAYEELIGRYQQPVYSLVYRLLDDPSESADVVQEVFLKVFRNIASFRGGSSLKTWIYRIAYNEAWNHRRWFTRHKKPEIGLDRDDDESLGFQDVLQDGGRSAFDLVSDHETHALIEEALGLLNPAFRAAVILRDIEDLSYEEIAEVLGVSLGTVKSRILRGREALRKTLTSRLKPEPALDWSPQPAR